MKIFCQNQTTNLILIRMRVNILTMFQQEVKEKEMIQIGMWMKQLICHMHVRIVLRNFLPLQKWKSTKCNVHPQISWNHQLKMKQFI